MAYGGIKMQANGPRLEEYDHEPLDIMMLEYTTKSGNQKLVSAINIGFMETREYVYYKPLPSLTVPDTALCKNYDNAVEEEWLERLSYLEEDLHWVLKLPYHRFWSQVVYDEDLHKCLHSYLSQAPRSYDLHPDVREELLQPLQRLHKLVFLVFLRLSTYKESKIHHITPKVFGDIIYEHYIFDIPKIMDLCALYGFQNHIILSKMVENVFSNQPNYLEDLTDAACSLLTVFDTIEERLQIKEKEHNKTEPVKLCNTSSSELFDLPSLLDIVNYISDTAATIHAFLEIYPAACSTFYESGAIHRIASFYENVFLVIQNEMRCKKSMNEFKKTIEYMKKKAVLSKTLFVKIFHAIISYCIITPLLELRFKKGEFSSESCVHCEDFLQIFTEACSEKNFIQDYNKIFPFDNDLDIFSEAGISLDPTRISYIFSSIHNLSESVENKEQAKSKEKHESELSLSHKKGIPVKNLHSLAAALTDGRFKTKTKNDNASVNGACAAEPDEAQMQSLIQLILDVLPNYGDGFVQKCLEHYNYSSEKVIDALLQSSLPDHLNSLDKNLKREKIAESGSSADSYSVLNERRSIFDNDEFDVFNRTDIPMDRIHMGKSGKTPETYNALKDEDSSFLKELILNYDEEDEFYREEPNIYEDEYDDTYDSAAVLGIREVQLETDSHVLRPFRIPRILETTKKKKEIEGKLPEEEEEEEEEEGEEEKTEKESEEPIKKPDDFCVNPEIIRQKAEERRQSKMRHQGNNHQRTEDRPKSSSSFQNKERHKGQSANHNRRKQSDYKKSRGMV